MTASDTYLRRTPLWLGVILATGLVLAAGCTRTADHGRFQFTGELRLVSFDSCDAAADRLRAATLDQVGPWGLNAPGAAPVAVADLAEADGAAPPAAGAADRAAAPGPVGEDFAAQPGAEPGPAAGSGHSGTNVHEAGVDEPDLVKTDGVRIVTVVDGTLRVVDAQRRVETGTLRLPGGAEFGWQAADLLLHGDRALVLVQESWLGILPVPDPAGGARTLPAPGPGILPMPEITGPRLLLVDLSAGPRLLGEYTVDGSLVDARQVGGTARVVVRSGPRLDFPMLDHTAGERERLAANRKVVQTADVSRWLPRYQVTSGTGVTDGQVACTAVSHPVIFSGTSMLTVLTFDLDSAALGDGAPVSVVADGDTVYSNGTSLYVASDQRWRSVPDRDGRLAVDEHTELYKFDTSQPGPPRYVASGAVPGWLINQYAVSEWEGHLRVATTTTGDTGDGRLAGSRSESAVYVMAQRGGQLVPAGSVGGLGAGEQIYSVRFAGPVGYVVTFRRTDPLYTLDLTDPSAPAVLGELKITGYSSYLHPIGGGGLLGVGQEADLDGVIQGTQISLFDVSDLADPRLRAKHHVRYGHSEVEFDPHAFLWWPAEQLVVLPLVVPPSGFDRGTVGYGALVLRVDGGGFTELELISHPAAGGWEHSGQIRRALVVGDTLWTVSSLGLQANDLATLRTSTWIPFR
jgi:hypothetical protein